MGVRLALQLAAILATSFQLPTYPLFHLGTQRQRPILLIIILATIYLGLWSNLSTF